MAPAYTTMTMHVTRITSAAKLDSMAERWNALTGGVPLRSWDWLDGWWNHYGDGAQLFVLAVHDDDGRLVGIAPWYCRRERGSGTVVRFLGSGEACTDYLTILTSPEHERPVAAALARWLTDAARGGGRVDREAAEPWHLLKLSGVDETDTATSALIEQLRHRGNTIHRREGLSCWRIELPDAWGDYVATLSKSHRKQVRRIERRYFDSGRAVPRIVGDPDELPPAMDLLIDVHQRRRATLDEPGCFASAAFERFLREAADRLFDRGQLRLQWIEVDGRPAAAEFQIAGERTTFAYQAGIEPELLDVEPGRLINVVSLRRAIDEGQTAFDFLRGDEPYKMHWRADSRPSVEFRVVPNRAIPRIRHGAWLAGGTLKSWIKAAVPVTAKSE